MPRPPLSEAGYNAALIALPFVCLFVFLFNSYRLGKWNMKWYQDMSIGQRRQFQKIVVAFIIGIVLVCMIGYSVWSHSFSIEKWQTDPENRTRIVDDLLDNYQLKGMSKKEVFSLLGSDEKDGGYSVEDNRLTYFLGPERGLISIDSEWLIIDFTDGIVSDYFITTD